MLRQLTFALLITALLLADVSAEEQRKRVGKGYPPVLSNAKTEVYKIIGDVRLNIYIFQPRDHQPSGKRPAIIFFFGGGWRAGSPKQFEKQCEYLASRGMLALAADYRVASRHNVKADRCVADAKSAVRWVRVNAERLGVDPERIVASGGSAGGHIAACTGTIDGLDEAGEKTSLSSRPNALILFNPALVLAPVDGEFPLRDPEKLKERTGVEPKVISPYHHVSSAVPPTLILHGKQDRVVPYKTAEWFCTAMQKAGSRCELTGYDGAGHGFFNLSRRNGKKYFVETLQRADRFLVSLGYLSGDDSVERFFSETSSAK